MSQRENRFDVILTDVTRTSPNRPEVDNVEYVMNVEAEVTQEQSTRAASPPNEVVLSGPEVNGTGAMQMDARSSPSAPAHIRGRIDGTHSEESSQRDNLVSKSRLKNKSTSTRNNFSCQCELPKCRHKNFRIHYKVTNAQKPAGSNSSAPAVPEYAAASIRSALPGVDHCKEDILMGVFTSMKTIKLFCMERKSRLHGLTKYTSPNLRLTPRDQLTYKTISVLRRSSRSGYKCQPVMKLASRPYEDLVVDQRTAQTLGMYFMLFRRHRMRYLSKRKLKDMFPPPKPETAENERAANRANRRLKPQAHYVIINLSCEVIYPGERNPCTIIFDD